MYETVTDRVKLVGGPQLSSGQDCLVYVVDLGELLLIDNGCGPSWRQIRDNIREAGYHPKAIHTMVLTHCHVDHIGATAGVFHETGCRVVAHELDAEAIESGDPRLTASSWYGIDLPPVRVTRTISGHGEVLKFSNGELRLIHTPGHTPGSMVAVIEDAGQRVLFGQDIHGPFVADFGSDIDAWRTSMKELLALEADILCEGHFGIYKPADAVRQFIEDHLAQHKV